MTTEDTYARSATEIMVLVDEFPTEPLSLERRDIELQIARKIEEASGLASDEDDAAYQAGYDEGVEEGRYQAEQDYEDRISELEEQVNDLETEIEDLRNNKDESFAEGYETASRMHGSNETLEFS